MVNTKKKIDNIKYHNLLFWMCFLAYFSTYIGRLNYNAVLVEIIKVEDILKSDAGLVSTGAFLSYGIGQIISGILGDRVSSKKLMFTGLFVSSIANIGMALSSSVNIMIILWSVNGFFQSMTWCPIMKLFTDYIKKDRLKKSLIDISTTVPLSTVFVYLSSATIVKFTNWRGVFYFGAGFMILVSLIWLFVITKIENHSSKYGQLEEVGDLIKSEKQSESFYKLLVVSGTIITIIALVSHGILKDGVTTWVPTYLSEVFNVGSFVSIISTTMLPVINLFGVYLSSYLNNKIFKNELVTSGVFFLVAIISVLMLSIIKSNMILSICFLTLTTSAMMGVNTLMISIMPIYFSKYGKTSTFTGFFNSFTYLGSAISTFGIGKISENYGWNITIISWLIIAIIGALACIMSQRKWNEFKGVSK